MPRGRPLIFFAFAMMSVCRHHAPIDSVTVKLNLRTFESAKITVTDSNAFFWDPRPVVSSRTCLQVRRIASC
jgi:hypothetical protein